MNFLITGATGFLGSSLVNQVGGTVALMEAMRDIGDLYKVV